AVRQAELARGPRADVQLLSGRDHPQEQLRLRDDRSHRGGLHEAGHEAGRDEADGLDQGLEGLVAILLGGVFHASILFLVAAGLLIAVAIGWLLTRTAFGRIMRAAADNREMVEALGVDMRRVYVRVFTLGTALGTLGGALVIPSTAAMSEMGIELIVEAFAVVVIGGLGSMRGAFVCALVFGVLRSIAISVYPELEMLLIYLIVIAVLVLRPRGLFGGPPA